MRAEKRRPNFAMESADRELRDTPKREKVVSYLCDKGQINYILNSSDRDRQIRYFSLAVTVTGGHWVA